MDTWNKYVAFTLLWISLISNVSVYKGNNDNDSFIKNLRKKRQSGYVYDKPNISFDLPTRSTTQLPNVNRIPSQMYYAYPVPAEKNVVPSTKESLGGSGYKYEIQNTGAVEVNANIARAGYSSTSATGTSGGSGYNYEAQNNGVSQNIGNAANAGYSSTVNGATGTSGGLGYNYEVQSIGVSQNNANVANTGYSSTSNVTIGTSGVLGYNYEVQNNGVSQNNENAANTGYSSTGNAATGASGESEYNYEVQNNGVSPNNVDAANTGYSSTGNAATAISGASGYNYEVQNNGMSQNNGNAGNVGYSGTGNAATGMSTRTGYNYEKQSIANAQPIVNQQLVNSLPRSNQEKGRIIDVSTNAPTYLPPLSNLGTIDKPFESYIPPRIKEISEVRSSQTLVTTNSPIIQQAFLNSAYLTPNMKNSNIAETGQMLAGNIQVTPTSVEYLPPMPTSTPVQPSSPSIQYLTQNSISEMQKISAGIIEPNVAIKQQLNSGYLAPNIVNSSAQRAEMINTNAHQYLPPRNSDSLISPPASTYLPPVF